MSKEPINDILLEEVAKELDIPINQVKEVVQVQSKFTAHVMRSNLFDAIRWPYLGVFKAKVKAANVLNYMKGLTKEQKRFFQDQQTLKFEKKYKVPSKKRRKNEFKS